MAPPAPPSPRAGSARYVPAAGRGGLTALYDPVMALTMRERTWRPRLAERLSARCPVGGRVIDVGSGTGTFALQVAGARPDVEVLGIDGDRVALDLAAGKPGAARVRFAQGLADALPVETASADAVVLSLVLHHLEPAGKRAALGEARRVLRPGGRLHVVDWGRPSPRSAPGFLLLQALDGRAGTRDHAAGRMGGLLAAAGFHDVVRYGRLTTAWGTLDELGAAAGG